MCVTVYPKRFFSNIKKTVVARLRYSDLLMMEDYNKLCYFT